MLRLIRVLARLLFFPLLWLRRRRAALPHGWVGLTIGGELEDMPARRRFWDWRARRKSSLHSLDLLAGEVAGDPRARGLLITLKAAHFGMATATSLRGVIARVRQGGKRVAVLLPYGGGSKEYFVAAGADQIVLGRRAGLSPAGFAAATPYLRRALERAGVVPEILARGRYKSAGEPLVRDAMSPEQREQLEALLGAQHRALVKAIAEGRGLAEDRAAELIDHAPYSAAEAVEKKLVDAALYDDETMALVAPGSPSDAKPVPAQRYLKRRHGLRSGLGGARIGVVRVHGAIVQAGEAPWVSGSDESVRAALAVARKSKRVVGVILHVDSPGGSALASDRIHREVARLAHEKPVVACMANVAASGGYYVAAAAHAIVAQPTTITGSIGVVAARFVLQPLLAKLGIRAEIVKRGARADLGYPTHELSQDERGALERELDGVYDAFLDVVAEGRNKTRDEVHELAQGRVWSGEDAHARGLVDTLGGFDAALEAVRARVGPAAASARPEVIAGPLRGLSSAEKDVAALARAVERLGVALPGPGAGVPWVWGRERVLALMDLGFWSS